jgi:two-component system response regulator AtoC
MNCKSLTESLADYEETLIRQALIENDWNQSKAARALGISEQTMRYKMGKLGIMKPS